MPINKNQKPSWSHSARYWLNNKSWAYHFSFFLKTCCSNITKMWSCELIPFVWTWLPWYAKVGTFSPLSWKNSVHWQSSNSRCVQPNEHCPHNRTNRIILKEEGVVIVGMWMTGKTRFSSSLIFTLSKNPPRRSAVGVEYKWLNQRSSSWFCTSCGR